jgi:hypothetical protein
MAIKALDGLPRYGWLACLSAVLSMLACYGTLAAITLLSLLGIRVAVNPQAWAAVIVALAALSAVLLAVNFTRHRAIGPPALAVGGTLLLGWVMYASYSRGEELLGFALLLSATAWDFRLRKCAPAEPSAS